MNLKEYEKISRRTLNINGTFENNYKLGMIGELGEIADMIKKHKFQGHELDREKFKEEIGDFMWYYVKYLTLQGMRDKRFKKLENHIKRTNKTENLDIIIYSLNNISKDMFKNFADFAIGYVADLISFSNFTLNEILEYNIEKLNKRYPDGFTQERSVNREK
jgi:NTP pyrophosphatase (non-canonical NTP hydrolase)